MPDLGASDPGGSGTRLCCVTLGQSFPFTHPSFFSSLNLQDSGENSLQTRQASKTHPRVLPIAR